MESLAIQLLQGERPDIVNSCPHLKQLIKETKQGRIHYDEFVRILTEPENALTKQYSALMETEGIELIFEPDAVEEMAGIAVEVNDRTQEIGARRLYTVMERVLDNLSFDASERDNGVHTVTADYVRESLLEIVEDQDLSRFIL